MSIQPEKSEAPTIDSASFKTQVRADRTEQVTAVYSEKVPFTTPGHPDHCFPGGDDTFSRVVEVEVLVDGERVAANTQCVEPRDGFLRRQPGETTFNMGYVTPSESGIYTLDIVARRGNSGTFLDSVSGQIEVTDPQDECVSDGECPGKLVCVDGRCVECRDDTDCAGTCVNNECVPPDNDPGNGDGIPWLLIAAGAVGVVLVAGGSDQDEGNR